MEEAAPRSAGPFHIGQLLAGTFEVKRVLGAGGMGVVYEAYDRHLLRTVAIKAPNFALHSASLKHEAQALAAIHSPHFVKVHGLWQHDGVDFLVMERLYGETLSDRLDEIKLSGKRMALVEALDLLIAISDALSAAHRVGIPHRDLKPANVMLCQDRVVLIDLGLFIPEVLVGPDNVAAGSVDYICPEVLLNEVKPGNGPLIDLYALGALAFELLTNAPPFTADSLGHVMLKHLSTAPEDIRTQRADIPAELAFLIAELLAKNPMQRPASAEAVLWQLQDIERQSRGARKPTPMMTILAVDDDAGVGTALKRSLESVFPQLHVEATTDPRRAIPALDYGKSDSGSMPDIILVDLNMPAHNGIEVCMSLLALPKAQRPMVVAMSSEAGPGDVAVLRSLGVEHFVPKDEAFVTAMSKVIGTLRAQSMTTRASRR